MLASARPAQAGANLGSRSSARRVGACAHRKCRQSGECQRRGPQGPELPLREGRGRVTLTCSAGGKAGGWGMDRDMNAAQRLVSEGKTDGSSPSAYVLDDLRLNLRIRARVTHP